MKNHFVTAIAFTASLCNSPAQTLVLGPVTPGITISNPELTAYTTSVSRNFYISSWQNSSGGVINHIYTFQTGGTSYNEDIETPGQGNDKGDFNSLLGGKHSSYLFSTLFDKSLKKNMLSVFAISPALDVKDESAEAGSIPAEKANRSGEFGVNKSPSANYFVSFGQYPKEKAGNEKFSICVLDGSAQKKWEKEYEFPLPSAKNVFNDVFISDKGAVVIVKRLDLENFSVFTIPQEKGNLVETKLELDPGRKINNYSVSFSEEGNAIVTGYYTEDKEIKGSNINFNGMFFFKINGTDGKLIVKTTQPLAKPLQHIQIKTVVASENNSTLLVGEYMNKESQGMGGMQAQDKTGYTCKNVYLSYFDANGKLLWSAEIEKEAQTLGDGALFSSCCVHSFGDKFLVMINDEKKRYSMNEGKIPVLFLISKKDGTKEKPVPLFNPRIGGKSDINLITSASLKTSDKEFMFIAGSEEGIYPVILKMP
jgi:hypothetical protein